MITILLALATVAADPGKKNDTTATTAPATATAVPAQPAAAEPGRRYCISDALTGSRVAKKVCRTREEWARAGVDLR